MDTINLPVPHDRTAQRPDWIQLPTELREAISDRLASPVSRAEVKYSGFSPGFAAVVHTADRRAGFIKAIHVSSDLAAWYRVEAAISAELPSAIPAPRFRWQADLAEHVVLCFDTVVGRVPAQPWQARELRSALRAQEVIAMALADPPSGLRDLVTTSFSQTAVQDYGHWARVLAAGTPEPAVPAWAADRLSELAELEALLPALTEGATSMIHYDLRPDNIIITNPYSWALVCDWNWLRFGPAWVDTVSLLISASAHHDVDALLAAHPTTAGMPGRAVEAQLAAYAGRLLAIGSRPPATDSPYLNVYRYQAGVNALNWLRRRMHW